MTLTDQRFATLAVERGFITSSQLDRARERLQKQGGELAALLVEMGLITSPQRQTLQGFIDREHAAAKDPENLVGEVLGGCRIIRSVGTGGMGSTYLAHHQRLDREVAVKVLHPRLTRIPNMAERFKREAQAAAKLSHPNIISVFDFDRVGDLYFMIMEFVRGRNLKEILEESGPFSVPDSIYIIDEVLKGLTVAHDLGIVHRDIKPANIILDEQTRRVSITDFGTVRLLNSASSQNLSSFGEILGTPQYMAPEQATADEIDGRTDLYAVGITLFELLEGRAPFSGASAVEVLEKQILSELPPLSEKNSGLSEFVAKLTAKKKEDRFANATEAARRLEILFRRMSHNFADLNLHRDPSRATNVPAIDSGSIDAIAQRLQHGQHLALVSFEAAEQEQAAPTQDPAKGTAAVLQSALSGDLDHVLAEIAQGPKGDTLVPELLLLLWQKKRHDELIRLAPIAETALPKIPAIPFFAGLAHAAGGDFERARSCFAIAAGLDSTHIQAQIHLASSLMRLGRVVEAAEVMHRLAVLNPNSALAATRLAEFLSGPGQDDERAAKAYERAISLAPDRRDLRLRLAQILVKLESFERAEDVIKELNEWGGPADPELEALSATINSARSARANSSGRLRRVTGSLKPADLGAAASQTARRRTRELPNLEPRLELMRLAVAGGKMPWLEQIYRDACAAHPNEIKVAVAFAQGALHLGQVERAVSVFEDALKIDPSSFEAQLGLAACQRAREQGSKN